MPSFSVRALNSNTCVLQCVAVCCSVLQCVAVCCSVLQCVAACCSVSCSVLQCVAVCCSCSMLQSIYTVVFYAHIEATTVQIFCVSLITQTPNPKLRIPNKPQNCAAHVCRSCNRTKHYILNPKPQILKPRTWGWKGKFLHVYIYTHIYIKTYICIHILYTYMYVEAYVCMHACSMHTHMYACMHISIYAYKYLCMYAYMHTYARKFVCVSACV